MLSRIFPSNVHPIERGIRVALGAALLSLYFVGPQTWLGLIGVVPILTGLGGTCPAYTLFGFSTWRKHKQSATT